MIKNKQELVANIPPELANERRILLNIADYVLENITSEKLLKGKLRAKLLKDFERIAVIGIGKAAKGMVKAVLPFLPKKPCKILLADKGHPLPTEEGLKNTEKIIKTARELGEKDLAIVLISGGGSAMLVSPAPGIKLADKITVTKKLLRSGATINEMNVVRKHLSQIKGGWLAALLYPAGVWGFVISDVVGNDLSTIASGPLSPDKSTFADALKILKKYRVKAPERAMEYLLRGSKDKNLETPKPGSKYFNNVNIKIIADHSTVIQKALEKAKKLGLKTAVIKKLVTGEAREAAKKFVREARKNTLFIGAGETTVTCRGKGFGGRNQEFVLSGLEYLKKGQTLLSIGTDGVDGICLEPIAGAIADAATLESAKKQGLKISEFLRRNDSGNFFKKAGGHIKTGPTGTNLGDFCMLIDKK